MMKVLLEILLSKYRKDNRTKFLCCFINTIKLSEENKEQLRKYVQQKATDKEALEICNRYYVNLQPLPLEFGLFADWDLSYRQQRKLRIEWLKLLIQNESTILRTPN